MMRRSLLLILLLVPCLASAQARFPKPRGFVNDFAGVIPDAEENRTEAICRELNQKTGAELAVVTVRELEGLTVETYANELFEDWGIGKKGEDNGVLILLAVTERKIWIEVGYGLEPVLPAGKAGGILDQYAMPFLSQNDFGNGLYAGASAVALTIAEDAGVTLTGGIPASQRPASGRRVKGIGIVPIIIFIILMIVTRGRILPWLLFFMMMGGGRGGGGSFGGGGFGGGFGGFGGGSSGGGGAGRSF
jgi:uncharacterized protein